TVGLEGFGAGLTQREVSFGPQNLSVGVLDRGIAQGDALNVVQNGGDGDLHPSRSSRSQSIPSRSSISPIRARRRWRPLKVISSGCSALPIPPVGSGAGSVRLIKESTRPM